MFERDNHALFKIQVANIDEKFIKEGKLCLFEYVMDDGKNHSDLSASVHIATNQQCSNIFILKITVLLTIV
jgi:hypothetical protein